MGKTAGMIWDLGGVEAEQRRGEAVVEAEMSVEPHHGMPHNETRSCASAGVMMSLVMMLTRGSSQPRNGLARLIADSTGPSDSIWYPDGGPVVCPGN